MKYYDNVPMDDDSIQGAAIDLMSAWNDEWDLLEHRLMCARMMMNMIQDRNGLRDLMSADPPMMTTPIGLLTVDSEGMRKLVDYANSLNVKENKTVKAVPVPDSMLETHTSYIPPNGLKKLYDQERYKGAWGFQD